MTKPFNYFTAGVLKICIDIKNFPLCLFIDFKIFPFSLSELDYQHSQVFQWFWESDEHDK